MRPKRLRAMLATGCSSRHTIDQFEPLASQIISCLVVSLGTGPADQAFTRRQ
jgi:hypothetical protein